MWVPDADEGAWQSALDSNGASDAAIRGARFFLQIAAQCNEVFVGNETRWLVQLLAAPSDDGGELDVLASLLEPSEEGGTRLCCTARGPRAAALLALFLDEHPEAPALLPGSAGSFEYVLCEADQEAWTRGPVTLARLKSLWALNSREKIGFFLPAEKSVGRFPEKAPQLVEASLDEESVQTPLASTSSTL